MNRRIRLGLLALTFASSGALAVTSGPTSNPSRAYPPSCLSAPLQEGPSGPQWSANLTVPAFEQRTGLVTDTEAVLVTLWRVPCADGKSALLGSFKRSPANAGRTDVQPLFPAFFANEGAATNENVRVAAEPNTYVSQIAYGTPSAADVVFVLENLAPGSGEPLINYNTALSILAVPVEGSSTLFTIPAYDRTKYAAASQPLPLTGYLSGNYFDPAHGGEGVEILIGSDTGTSRLVTAAWYTYDATGTPFWLFGQGGFDAGDRTATLTVVYATGGGFAGNFGQSATNHPWGTVSIVFTNCSTLRFQYQANAGLPPGVPQGSGTKTWTKLFGQNGLTCD